MRALCKCVSVYECVCASEHAVFSLEEHDGDDAGGGHVSFPLYCGCSLFADEERLLSSLPALPACRPACLPVLLWDTDNYARLSQRRAVNAHNVVP